MFNSKRVVEANEVQNRGQCSEMLLARTSRKRSKRTKGSLQTWKYQTELIADQVPFIFRSDLTKSPLGSHHVYKHAMCLCKQACKLARYLPTDVTLGLFLKLAKRPVKRALHNYLSLSSYGGEILFLQQQNVLSSSYDSLPSHPS